jgi:hypothetical protein
VLGGSVIWVTWRQQRVQILVIAGIVLLLVAMLVYVRADVLSLLPDKGLISDKYDRFLENFALGMLALPVLAGMFTGAPLFAREIEQGTHIFGLTQQVSRRRWLVTKLAMAGGSLTVSMFVLGLVAAWALEPVNFVMMSSKLSNPLFDIQGLTVGAYTLMAFTIGTTAGLLLRNTVVAMVVTLVAYTVLVIAVSNGVRPYYAEPTRVEFAITSAPPNIDPLETWAVRSGYLDASGKELDTTATQCPPVMPALRDCMRELGIAGSFAEVHLPSQFWRFQLTELGLFLTLSAGLFGAGMWFARRRLT